MVGCFEISVEQADGCINYRLWTGNPDELEGPGVEGLEDIGKNSLHWWSREGKKMRLLIWEIKVIP